MALGRVEIRWKTAFCGYGKRVVAGEQLVDDLCHRIVSLWIVVFGSLVQGPSIVGRKLHSRAGFEQFFKKVAQFAGNDSGGFVRPVMNTCYHLHATTMVKGLSQ